MQVTQHQESPVIEMDAVDPVTSIVLRALDVMSTPVRTVSLDDSLWDVWSVLNDAGVHHVVAVAGSRVVGVVDDRTLFAHWPTSPLGARWADVRSLIRPRTSCVLPATSLARVAEIMMAEDVDAVPVTAVNGTLLGLVTSHDLTAAVARCGLVGSCPAPEPKAGA